VVVTISAGNSGEHGPFYASNGSSGKNVIAVASTESNAVASPPFKATFSLNGVSNTTVLAYQPPLGVFLWNLNKTLPIIPISTDFNDDACNPLPSTTPDLTQGIALVRRGNCEYNKKETNLVKLGAKYILYYNDDEQVGGPWSTTPGVLVGLIDKKAGEDIIATVRAGGNVTADFSNPTDSTWVVDFNNTIGGLPSYFTSWGPTFDLDIKPDIAAPGGHILSTYIGGGFTVLSGTSMSCPYVAGVAALYIGKYGGRSVHGPGFAKDLANRIITSGSSVPWQTKQPSEKAVDYGFWAPVAQVGNGFLDAWKILSYETSLTYDKFTLNDTAHFSRYHKVQITNNGNKAVTYNFTLQPAGGFNAASPNGIFIADLTTISPQSMVPTVSFPTGNFIVKPGETKTAQINFEAPTGLNETQLPVYSGKILITGDNGEQLSVPYLGAAFDLKAQARSKMFPPSTPRQISGPYNQDIDVYHVYAFNISREAQDYPHIYTQYYWGVNQLRWDLFEAGWKESQWKYPPVVGENGYVGSVAYSAESRTGCIFNPDTMNRSDVISFPVSDLTRSSNLDWSLNSFCWLGNLANGSYIAPGNYT
jgi:subtilisin family serine protease